MSTFELGLGLQTLQILGWALLHSLWIGALVGLIFGVLRPVVRDHITLRYWLGVSCLFAFAGLEIALFVNALFNVGMIPQELVAKSSETLILAALDSQAATQLSTQPNTIPLTMLIGFAWLLGVGVSTWRLMRSHRTLQLLAFNAQTDSYSELRHLCAPLLELLNLHTKVRFAVSELIDVPCVIGLFKPLVLLPAALLARMPQDQLELVLLHELSHIKNGDLWINSAQIVVEVLMFFHPVVHWISADVRATRERRCDLAVLSVRATPVRYAHALVSLEEFRHEFRGLTLAATGGELTARVRDILASRARSVRINTRRSMRGTVLLSLAATIVLTGVVSSAIVRRAVTTPTEAAMRTDVLPDQVNAGLETLAQARAAHTPNGDMQIFGPVSTDSSRLTSMGKAQTPPALARKVLSARKSLLAMQTRPQHILERIETPELASMSTHVIEHSADETSADETSADELTADGPKWDETSANETSAETTPKLIKRVQPIFAFGQQRLQDFTLSFTLDAAGIPQQIKLAHGKASKKQLLAAQTALAQWRFEPKASAQFNGNRLEQAFSFRELTSDECKPTVGTRICR